MASLGDPSLIRPPPVPPHSPPPCSSSDSSLPTLWSPPVIHTCRSSAGVSAHHRRRRSSSDPVPSPGSALRQESGLRSGLLQLPVATPNPYPTPPPSHQASVTVPSPELRPPDVECCICFSQFNNVFRCPKMLRCKHTFCLECLARINVKSAEPGAIQCPLCRGLTPLPALGLPRLATDPDVLSCLPAAMQRVYSVRFVRSKGKLQVKRSAEAQRRWGQRSPATRRSLNVGLPSPAAGSPGEAGGVGGALFRLTDRPACRAVLLASMVMMMVLLTGAIIFLLAFNRDAVLP